MGAAEQADGTQRLGSNGTPIACAFIRYRLSIPGESRDRASEIALCSKLWYKQVRRRGIAVFESGAALCCSVMCPLRDYRGRTSSATSTARSQLTDSVSTVGKYRVSYG